jgi:hypothetical protein
MRVHALIAKYNVADGTVVGAADGGVPASFGGITFDGPTSDTIIFGVNHDGLNPYIGYIGEGVLTAGLENDSVWVDFWERVKDSEWLVKPLMYHNNWRIINGTTPDYYGYNRNTSGLVLYNAPADVKNMVFKDFRDTWGIITAQNVTDLGGTANWILPFAKFKDANNLVGARINNGVIEIVQRNRGRWTTLGSAPVTEGNWLVQLMNAWTEIYINGISVLKVNHAMRDAGYYGISGHRIDNAGEVCTNYDVSSTDTVTHLSVPITVNGEKVINI